MARRRSADAGASSKIGRPTTFTPQIGEEICRMVIEGKTISRICTALAIDRGRLFAWLAQHHAFADQYARARELSAFTLESEALDVARAAIDRDTAAIATVRLATIRWVASKRAPKVYGDIPDRSYPIGRFDLATEAGSIATLHAVTSMAMRGQLPAPLAKELATLAGLTIQAHRSSLEGSFELAFAQMRAVMEGREPPASITQAPASTESS